MRVLLCLPLLLAAPDSTVSDDPVLVLPDGGAAKVWAGVGPETAPSSIEDSAGDWSNAATWRRWAQLVSEESKAERPNPARRSALCLLARDQGRGDDVWRHYALLGSEPGYVAAVTPALLPGLPAGSKVEAGGRPATLANDTLLTPFLPPSKQEGFAGAIEWREATAKGIRIGEAICDLTIVVDAQGVQVDLTHVGGGSGRVQVVLPEPAGFEIAIEYVNWMKRGDEERGGPVTLELRPDEEPHQIYGRLKERRLSMPTLRATQVPAGMKEGGLLFELAEDDPDRAFFTELASIVSGLLEVEVSLVAPGSKRERWTGTLMAFPSGPSRVERLRYLASSIEGYLLRTDD